eukprot:14584702-Heterocapsa_arctica.AAC.1
MYVHGTYTQNRYRVQRGQRLLSTVVGGVTCILQQTRPRPCLEFICARQEIYNLTDASASVFLA